MKTIRDYLILLLGSFLYAAATVCLVFPNSFSFGGTSGIGDISDTGVETLTRGVCPLFLTVIGAVSTMLPFSVSNFGTLRADFGSSAYKLRYSAALIRVCGWGCAVPTMS